MALLKALLRGAARGVAKGIAKGVAKGVVVVDSPEAFGPQGMQIMIEEYK